VIEEIIAKERPDGVLVSMGGQTALNVGIELWKAGVFEKYNCKVLGTSIETIIATEDRELFSQKLAEIDERLALSYRYPLSPPSSSSRPMGELGSNHGTLSVGHGAEVNEMLRYDGIKQTNSLLSVHLSAAVRLLRSLLDTTHLSLMAAGMD
jgi:hypothetical protein